LGVSTLSFAPLALILAATASGVTADGWVKEVRRRAGDEPIFLMRKSTGEIVGRTATGKVTVPLVASASADVLYDGGLELLWMRSGEQVDVVDLRTPKPAPVTIMRGVPKDLEFTVSVGKGRQIRSVSRPGGCEVDSVVDLQWFDSPKVDFIGKRGAKPLLVGKSWLETNHDRAGEPGPEVADFAHHAEASKVPLPAKVGHCERSWECGEWLPFGAEGSRLVLTGMKKKDRCRQYQCLLYDPGSKLFAAPLDPKRWDKAEALEAGSCGPFAFDAGGRWYLAGSKICTVKEGCRDLDGQAIGGLPPGPRVGDPE
jgi:hypothetical protein